MSKQLNTQDIQRYSNPTVVDHLASNYVLGLLSPRVRKRVEHLKNHFNYRHINERIHYWEQKMSPLHNSTPELAPAPETWKRIQTRLKLEATAFQPEQMTSRKGTSWFEWSSFAMWRWSGVFSIVLCILLSVGLIRQETPLGPLSYVAVLQDDNQAPQVVAATYGDSKQLVLDIINLPNLDDEQSYELWVTSKTDNQTRSLGEIPIGSSSYDRQLSEAEWRLIADSSHLAISIEDAGGSALGEPSDEIVSKGICVRLTGSGKTQV